MDISHGEQFEDAYRTLAPLCLRIAQKVLDDHTAAEDVVQDLFLQLWREPRLFDPARGPLQGYVTMVARSRSIDRWRTRQTERSACERLATESRTLSIDSAEGADQSALGAERRRLLLRALARLPDEQRDAVLLAFCGGLTARQIAHGAAVPIGTAKSRIRLGLSRARDHLSEAA